MTERWPALPYAAWKDTAATLHLWTQIAGKVRLARTPWLNHSWHVTLYVSARGLTTGPIPDRTRTFEIEFDFIDHVLWLRTSDGHFRQVMLRPVTVAEFYGETMGALGALGIELRSRRRRTRSPARWRSTRTPRTSPTTPITPTGSGACCRRRTMCSGNSVRPSSARYHRCISSGARFDLAVTRFSGRRAPKHPGGVPNLPDNVAQEAYSHEVSCGGLLAGRRRRGRFSGVLLVCLPGAGGLRAGQGEAGRGILPLAARRIHPAV